MSNCRGSIAKKFNRLIKRRKYIQLHKFICAREHEIEIPCSFFTFLQTGKMHFGFNPNRFSNCCHY